MKLGELRNLCRRVAADIEMLPHAAELEDPAKAERLRIDIKTNMDRIVAGWTTLFPNGAIPKGEVPKAPPEEPSTPAPGR